jgi:hypothetical protein
MSISSHLTPEPERRLWLILDNMRRSIAWSDWRVGALTAFAAAELAFLRPALPAGPLAVLATAALAAALPLGVLAFAPLSQVPKWLVSYERHREKPGPMDCFLLAEDIVKYTQAELILRMERYFGGGITATQYHEDLVAQVLFQARVAMRKHRLFRASCILVGIGQLGLFGQSLWSLLSR